MSQHAAQPHVTDWDRLNQPVVTSDGRIFPPQGPSLAALARSIDSRCHICEQRDYTHDASCPAAPPAR